MRFRFLYQARWCALVVTSLALAACGRPDDVPTAGAITQISPSPTVPATGTPAMPTPTLVPTASASTSAAPGASAGAAPTPAGTTATAVASASPSASPSAEATEQAEGAHPVAQVIADEFGVAVTEVEGYHDQGIGYGILAQFYSIAYGRCGATTAYTVPQLIGMKQSGMGMGEIRKEALGSAAANSCSLGKLKQDELDAADSQPQPPQESQADKQPDNKGNNGGNDDKGNGNGGNGNGGGNNDKGNGNGNGKEKGKNK